MYGDEFSKIKAAVEAYQQAGAFAEELQRRRQRISELAKTHKLQIAFVGNTAHIDVPEQMQSELAYWLDSGLSKLQSQCKQTQVDLTCPAGTNDR